MTNAVTNPVRTLHPRRDRLSLCLLPLDEGCGAHAEAVRAVSSTDPFAGGPAGRWALPAAGVRRGDVRCCVRTPERCRCRTTRVAPIPPTERDAAVMRAYRQEVPRRLLDSRTKDTPSALVVVDDSRVVAEQVGRVVEQLGSRVQVPSGHVRRVKSERNAAGVNSTWSRSSTARARMRPVSVSMEAPCQLFAMMRCRSPRRSARSSMSNSIGAMSHDDCIANNWQGASMLTLTGRRWAVELLDHVEFTPEYCALI